MKFKAVTFFDSSFVNCYFEDVTSVGSFFRNCTFVDSFFYNTGESTPDRPAEHSSSSAEPSPSHPKEIFLYYRCLTHESHSVFLSLSDMTFILSLMSELLGTKRRGLNIYGSALCG